MLNQLKIVSINAVSYGSTGNIMRRIGSAAEANLGARYYSFYGNWKNCPKEYKGSKRFGYRVENLICGVFSRISGLYYIGHIFGTLSLIRKIKKINPDIIHLHNLHLWVVNVPILFKFIKKNNIPVVWTFHDCWPVTGHCPHFTMAKCERWKNGCGHCPTYKEYPISYVDQSKRMWKWKKKWFSGIQNMTIITPSNWLKMIVEQSFLNCYPIRVVNNGVDINIFKPTKGNFREDYNITAKYIVLGLSAIWNEHKGLDIFIELAHRLSPDYQIVLVGTSDTVDRQLPNSIISIHRTQNQKDLAEIYTAADIFVNPTREETFPTVNMEAIACGTPVLTFKTGGSPEIIDDTCGAVVECDDIDKLEEEIIRITKSKCYTENACLKRAVMYDEGLCYSKYLDVYKTILGE